ncbi:hypothetical protein Bca101_050149 [Brassica carinata]
MAPLKQRGSFVLDDGPCSEIQEGGLKRASDGGPGEIAIFEAYLIAGFRGIVPSLVAEVSSFLGFCPSQLTPLSWKTLMSIQVLGELYGLDTGVHKVLYSYYFAPLTIMHGFYHLQPRDGAPLVEEPPRDVSRPVSFLGEAMARKMLAIPQHFREVHFLMSKEVLCHSRLWGNFVRLPAPVLYDEYQQAGTRRRRPFYAPPPRLTRATSPAAWIRPLPSRTVTGDAPLMRIRQWLLTELFLLRNRVQDMAAQRDLLIWQVRASARWELMKEWLEGRTERWDPKEEYRRYLLCSEESDHHFGGCP